MEMTAGKAWHAYRFVALTLVNTLAALLVLNAVLAAFFFVADRLASDPVSEKYAPQAIQAVYPGSSDDRIQSLLKETWSRPYHYEPFTQFRERPHRGVYVNVDGNGFRVTKNQGPWPPGPGSLNVFLFGGSSAFGYGVPDDQTIASHLQEYLAQRLGRDVRVYNFGRGHYYSTQERILYEELLASGFAPDVALFIDGLNDFYYHSNEPKYTARFRDFMAGGAKTDRFAEFFSKTSLGRAVGEVRAWLSPRPRQEPPGASGEEPGAAEEAGTGDSRGIVEAVVERYLANKRIIEAVSLPFGVAPVFVWQPVPMYRYDQRFHPFAPGGYGKHGFALPGYERMRARIAKYPPNGNFLWCADIQQGEEKALYVDKVHYTADFSRKFAATMADMIIERRLFSAPARRPGPPAAEETSAEP